MYSKDIASIACIFQILRFLQCGEKNIQSWIQEIPDTNINVKLRVIFYN